MGKNQKIPYLNEVIVYFIKAAIVFTALNYLMPKIGFYNQPLLLTFSIFAAFSFNPFYLSTIALSYLSSFWITNFGIGEISSLFLYLFSILLNTFFMIVYLKRKYKFKEEE